MFYAFSRQKHVIDCLKLNPMDNSQFVFYSLAYNHFWALNELFVVRLISVFTSAKA